MIGSSTFAGAFVFAVTGGVATFFAPCAFPLLPGYVGYFIHHEDTGRTGIVLPASLAATSALAVLGAVGAVGFTLGRAVLQHLPLLEPIVGFALIAFGVLLLSGHAPELRIPLPERSGSVLGFGLFGAAYAAAAAGCVVPVLLGVLTQALAFPPFQAAIIFGAYALSVALPLVGVTLLATVGTDVWRQLGHFTDHFQTIAAATMVLAGLGQLYLSVVVLDVLGPIPFLS
ncbi:cytochrome c biogenesis CcdA family protein [Halocatena pleomorpha]|uniref:Cytochrome C biogenesis protein n=1 Tax=Halocatena pleomorpha TaxID=1785090 RepID=A0A3P3R9V8_9EURY|nr:cytochrome c biogenesis protein CcdA [Halocatena pleomorpha]RRJ30257.1 cytochrome C biogenesis protein [Halocatena pleomorpha]